MEKFKGRAMTKGIAVGKIAVLRKADRKIQKIHISSPEKEWERLQTALEAVKAETELLYREALSAVGEENAAIFEIHGMLLEDEDFLEAMQKNVFEERVCAEFAVQSTGEAFAAQFSAMDDEYMNARAADLRDITSRLLNALCKSEHASLPKEPHILVAEDLSPSETVSLNKSDILGIVTVHGAPNSHTAILARTMNIPALASVPLDLETVRDGTIAVLDGMQEAFFLNPNEEVLSRAERKIAAQNKRSQDLQAYKGTESVTPDGRSIQIFANIGSAEDLPRVLENDAEGVGLFRSEFLYLGKAAPPSEEEQFRVYKHILEGTAGKRVILRTLDLGADKQASFLHLPKEENPALGCRGIRLCFQHPALLKTQLRAAFRAAIYGDLAVMYPMLTSPAEADSVLQFADAVYRELQNENIPCRKPPQGVMIETPAAAILSEALAKKVDFFSVGTNDLAQYTLAADRQNPRLPASFSARHEAVLYLIEKTVQNAHKAGLWVGICGELAADLSLTERFLDMGADELSVPPAMVLPLRKTVREMRTV